MLNAGKEINLLAWEQCWFPVYLEASFLHPDIPSSTVREDKLKRANFFALKYRRLQMYFKKMRGDS